MKKLINFIKEDDGATMVEYGIMVALIAAICITTIDALGDKVLSAFTTTEGNMP